LKINPDIPKMVKTTLFVVGYVNREI
jgi:hypothetical protein